MSLTRTGQSIEEKALFGNRFLGTIKKAEVLSRQSKRLIFSGKPLIDEARSVSVGELVSLFSSSFQSPNCGPALRPAGLTSDVSPGGADTAGGWLQACKASWIISRSVSERQSE